MAAELIQSAERNCPDGVGRRGHPWLAGDALHTVTLTDVTWIG
jgi:hypothetical protein